MYLASLSSLRFFTILFSIYLICFLEEVSFHKKSFRFLSGMWKNLKKKNKQKNRELIHCHQRAPWEGIFYFIVVYTFSLFFVPFQLGQLTLISLKATFIVYMYTTLNFSAQNKEIITIIIMMLIKKMVLIITTINFSHSVGMVNLLLPEFSNLAWYIVLDKYLLFKAETRPSVEKSKTFRGLNSSKFCYFSLCLVWCVLFSNAYKSKSSGKNDKPYFHWSP